MLLSTDEVDERLSSPLNLINRLRAKDNITSVSLPPKVDELIPDLDSKIHSAAIHGKAESLLSDTLDQLKLRLPEIRAVDKLSNVAANLNKIITAGNEAKIQNNQTNNIQVLIYAPEIKSEEDFDTINVTE